MMIGEKDHIFTSSSYRSSRYCYCCLLNHTPLTLLVIRLTVLLHLSPEITEIQQSFLSVRQPVHLDRNLSTLDAVFVVLKEPKSSSFLPLFPPLDNVIPVFREPP